MATPVHSRHYKLHRLEENIGSTLVELTANDLQELDSATTKITVEGDRYPPDLERMTYRLGCDYSR